MTDRYARIREALEALDAAGGDWISWETAFARYAKASQPDTVRELLAERDELAKDAARYRWLRARWGRVTDTYKGDSGHITWIDVEPDGEGWDADPDSLDAAIDAARKEAP